MKNLIDYKEEIHKCSKCGLCQSVCPVYEQTGNDCSVSRGKFIMLNGVVKGDLKLNKNINKYLDICLKCNACKNFCPSDIDARKIFLAAKSDYFKTCQSSKFIKGFQSKLIFNLFLNITKITTNTYRFLKLDKAVKLFYPALQKFELGKKIILANEFVSASNRISLTGKIPKRVWDDKLIKVVYFKGCINEYINPRVKNATENILKNMNVQILPAKFECCGVPFLSCGNVEQFKKQAEFNLKQIPDDFDYFLTDCASCQNAFAEYKNYIDDEILLNKIDKILEKSMNINEFIVKNAESFEFEMADNPKQNLKRKSRLGLLTQQHQTDNVLDYPHKISFTFHKPCHLENIDFIQEFLKKAKNVEYIEMKEFDKCCGFSGEFAIKNPELSKRISAKKAQNAISTKTDYILTACPACILGLNQGLIEHKKDVLTLNFIEFISSAEKIY